MSIPESEQSAARFWKRLVAAAMAVDPEIEGESNTQAALEALEAAVSALENAAPTPNLLGLVMHYPEGGVSYTTTASLADVDATNLVVTFTAPASGKVLVRLSIRGYNTQTNTVGYFAMREGTTMVVPQSLVLGNSAVNTWRYIAYAAVVSGLTPNQSYTWKWAALHVNNTMVLQWGSTLGPAVIEVWDAATP